VATLLAPLLSPWLTLLLVFWIGLIGGARVALQIHFASDVVAGWGTGVAVGLLLSPLL
jgi:membrane-associated phospholipid phosphatase